MPTQTNFKANVPGSGFIDLSGIFEPLVGEAIYSSQTRFLVNGLDLTGIFHESTSVEDRIGYLVGYKVGGTDLSSIFRRYGFVGITITDQPDNQIIDNAQNAVFFIVATENNQPFNDTYKWRKNGSLIYDGGKISGSDTDTLVVTAADVTTDGSYDCVLTSPNGSVTSNSALLKIKPYVITYPTSLTVNDLASATFTILANGSGTLSYQWYKNGNLINGATSSSYSIAQVNSTHIADYYCIIKSEYNLVGITSNTVSLSIIAPEVTASIIGYSPPYIFNNGTVITISSSISQGTNVSYQWYGPAGLIGGATSSSYQYVLSTSTDGDYYVVATNNGGSDTSNTVAVYVNPYIITNLSNITVNDGGNATFTVSAAGSGTLSYTWYRNTGSGFTTFGAADSPSFTEVGVNGNYNGYQYYCVITSSIAGTAPVQSSTATLNVNYLSFISLSVIEDGNSQPITVSHNPLPVSEGDSVTCEIQMSGYPTINYQWAKWNGSTFVNIGGATSSSLTFNPITTANAGYYVCFTNNGGSFVYDTQGLVILLDVYYANSITSQPSDKIANIGSSPSFSVSANGLSAPTYQWEISTNNGASYSSIGGATSSTYSESVIQTSDNQNKYRCVVSNLKDDNASWPNSTSNAATLTVVYLNEQTYNPGGPWSNGLVINANVGDLVGLKTQTINDNESSQYIWQKWDGSQWNNQNTIRGANLLPSENADQFVWGSIQLTDAGTYRCQVSNSYDGSPIYTQNFTVNVS